MLSTEISKMLNGYLLKLDTERKEPNTIQINSNTYDIAKRNIIQKSAVRNILSDKLYFNFLILIFHPLRYLFHQIAETHNECAAEYRDQNAERADDGVVFIVLDRLGNHKPDRRRPRRAVR